MHMMRCKDIHVTCAQPPSLACVKGAGFKISRLAIDIDDNSTDYNYHLCYRQNTVDSEIRCSSIGCGTNLSTGWYEISNLDRIFGLSSILIL